GCRASGLSEAESEALWDLIRPFAGYSFNRPHAIGYALIAYQTAWLKAHYPVEYLAALLTSVKGNNDKIPAYLAECRGLSIKVLPPDVNQSGLDFTAKGDEILFGLSAVRNVGEGVAERIINAREARGPFLSFHDFLRRVEASVLNKKVVESLAKAGAFDSLSLSRSALLAPDVNGASLVLSAQTMRLIEGMLADKRSEEAGQFSLFSSSSNPMEVRASGFEATLAGLEIPRLNLLAAEKEMLGCYVSDHPLAGMEEVLRHQVEGEISDLAEGPDGAIRTVGGILTRLDRKFTKRGELMLLGALEDMKGSVEVIFFPQTVRETPLDLLRLDRVVVAKGRIDLRDETPTLVVMAVAAPDLSGAPPLRIKMEARSCTPDRLEDLKSVLSSHPGPSPVLLHLG
ncbi:MAG: DNA polymerase III subunit alpha, partial [Candidatus Methylomirabilales bacterium]